MQKIVVPKRTASLLPAIISRTLHSKPLTKHEPDSKEESKRRSDCVRDELAEKHTPSMMTTTLMQLAMIRLRLRSRTHCVSTCTGVIMWDQS